MKDNLKKQKKDEETEYEGDEEKENDEETEEEEGKKSLSEEDLRKSLDALEEVVEASDETSRKQALLEKASSGDLDETERDELFGLLGGQAQTDPSLADSIAKSFEGNETLAKSLDVSDYLAAQHSEELGALRTLADCIEKSDRRQHEFNLVLAKAVVQMGGLVDGMSRRIGVVETQPARGPKAQGVQGAQPMAKSFGEGGAGGAQLSKSQTLDLLDNMMEKSMQAGGDGIADCGEDLAVSIAKYESQSVLSRNLHDEVVSFARTNGQGVH